MDEHEPLPKVQLGQLHLSFLGRTFPDATEPWDADLLTCTPLPTCGRRA